VKITQLTNEPAIVSRVRIGALAVRVGVLVVSVAVAWGTDLPSNSEGAFLSAMRLSMSAMMAGMNALPCGNIDQDFVAQMVPHHQGAIDMAKAELLYGRNERLRRIAQEIIVEQKAEIVVLQSEFTSSPTLALPEGLTK
jgi:hypothetical protein